MSVSIRKGFALGYEERFLCSFGGQRMRVSQNLLGSVAFLCVGDIDNPAHFGTAFLLFHRRMLYLVTAGHVAEGIGDSPFYARFNTVSGAAGLIPFDFATNTEPLLDWFAHPSSAVDLAVMPFPFGLRAAGIDPVVLDSQNTVETKRNMTDAGCGDMCHVIGLFAYTAGKSRNMPVVHTGHIAAMSDSVELIPMSKNGRGVSVEGYLVEISNLSGLSGAPVFVRGGLELDVPIQEHGMTVISSYRPDLKLLGIWAGSWDLPLSGFGSRAPVGVGVVTPAYRLIELLDSSPVAENRAQWLARIDAALSD